MKVLVCVASKYGATSEIAQAVADVLAGQGLEVSVAPPGQADAIEEFDAVVLGSAVYMGQWMKPARELAEHSAAALAARPVWLFSSGPVGEPASRPTTPWTSPRPPRHQRPRAPDLHRQAGQEAPQLPRPGHGLGDPRRRGRLPQLGRNPRLGGRHRRHPALPVTGDPGDCRSGLPGSRSAGTPAARRRSSGPWRPTPTRKPSALPPTPRPR